MKRALISVYEKRGIVEFAKKLVELGWQIISTGGTLRELKGSGIDVIGIEEVTGFPEILDGRVKTLNPYIHGGILYRRDDESHVSTVKDMNISSIDMVVNNLYPFEETLRKEDVTYDEIIENIDIGGPSMIRAAAKNYKHVTVIVDPEDYQLVLNELMENGETTLKTRLYLARKVFNYTAYYDFLISHYFNKLDDVKFPEFMTLGYRLREKLRYGENPHQNAAFYVKSDITEGSIAKGEKLHGKELSFNNINDGSAALDMVKEFDEPTVVAVKHANPCGIGSGISILEAYLKAYECDKESIYGGIVAANREIDEDTAMEMSKIFLEVIIAPSFTEGAIEILAKKKNLRLIQVGELGDINEEMELKHVSGGILIQDKDTRSLLDDIKVVTERKPTSEEMEDLMFAWKAVKHLKSNGVVIAKNKATIGIGGGEVNRFWAVENAIKRAKDNTMGSVLASDGFFPFKDSIELLGKSGITAIIQPGGSIRDEEVIEEANKYNIAMVFTGIRHFKH
ncbi:MAG TPA: bifunctional phosphoribosylaminoimidazolecarboxamide formyltransferase/IMP cyclohydrolase [Tissierellia bacterium]|nr:bifunctional phosphoribosylaminoimidazolecarboxamide formyltransferase/IMP cyclohydrolase [Tissierellia bacterium]